MVLFQEWFLINNIDDNINLINKLLDTNQNYYYHLSNNEIEELYERLSEFNKFKLLLKIKEDNYNNSINELKRKIKKQNDYINKIYLYMIIITLLFITFIIEFNHFFFW